MYVHSDRFIVMSDPTALGPDRGIGQLPSAKVVIIIENQPLIKPFGILMVTDGMRITPATALRSDSYEAAVTLAIASANLTIHLF